MTFVQTCWEDSSDWDESVQLFRAMRERYSKTEDVFILNFLCWERRLFAFSCILATIAELKSAQLSHWFPCVFFHVGAKQGIDSRLISGSLPLIPFDNIPVNAQG